ncbi:MAG: nitrile hydratase subunit beta [Shimia sp.]
MNGPHDMGGRDGFGPVVAEPDEPVFHAPWEARALGLTLCAGALGHWSLDESRHARESLPPATYLTASYYEIWVRALETLLLRHGEATKEELSDGIPRAAPRRPERKLTADRVQAVLRAGGPVERPADSAPRFAVGDPVRMRVDRIPGHTRLPRYAAGKVGRIVAVVGHHVYPDSNAHGGGEAPEWLYTVVFTGPELWGAGAEPGTEVTVDAWQPYLSPA